MKTDSQQTGLDVSHYQGTIDWAAVYASGRRFVFIKATEGAHITDSRFASNWKNAREAGLLTGAYHFFKPQIAVDLQVEQFVATVGTPRSGDLPPVLDVETPADWLSLPEAQRVYIVLAWLTAVEQRLGVRPILYLSPSFAKDILGSDSRLSAYPLWIAHYTSAPQPTIPKPWKNWTYWQHAESGQVPGVPGQRVDLDRFNGGLSQAASVDAQPSCNLLSRLLWRVKSFFGWLIRF